MARENDPIVARIDQAYAEGFVLESTDDEVLDSIRRQLVNHPAHEDANSVQVLHSLGVERLRRIGA